MGEKCDYNNSVEKFEQDSQSGPAPDRRINTMANCAIVGINWGDEGKGRMVDLISQEYDIVHVIRAATTPVTRSRTSAASSC